VIARVCVVCAKDFTVHWPTNPPRQTCSPKCRAVLMSTLLRGRKYGPQSVRQRICQRCAKPFEANRAVLCRRCSTRGTQRTHGKPERRAKRAGVPYVYGIKPAQVFERDQWRCQLCGCKTPQRLRGQNQPRSPEVDHITPISQGGGHTWDNVQCACRACNIAKRAHIRGQFRLAI
jgi:hypothetical protein